MIVQVFILILELSFLYCFLIVQLTYVIVQLTYVIVQILKKKRCKLCGQVNTSTFKKKAPFLYLILCLNLVIFFKFKTAHLSI
jgi:hypothetical protein